MTSLGARDAECTWHDVPVSTFALPRTLSRRGALRLTGGAALTAVGLATSAGCSSDTAPGPQLDTLTGHLRRARRDAAAAGALIALSPTLAGPLSVVQTERTAHADALAAEIDRVAGHTEEESVATSTTATPVAVPPPTMEELKADLSESQRGAADSAKSESGYRAGLLGSISAACAVELAVVLS